MTTAIKPRLPLLTTSSQKTFRSCPRKYKLRYVDGYRLVGDAAHSLHFGRLIHNALEAWWTSTGDDRLTAALASIAEQDADPFDRVKAEELMLGYHCRWAEETDRFKVLAVEQSYCVPLRNPATGAASRTFEHAGAKDAEIDRGDGGEWVVEHKTSSDDIGRGSAYWQRLRMDTQVSNYFNAAAEAGKDVRGCLYDIIKKPTIKPAMATPIEKRKYTKQGFLYAKMREADETPEEYRARLREDVAANPDKYFQRGDVVRLAAEAKEAAADLWLTAYAIKEAQRLGHFPRNTDRCFDWSRPCDYWAACSGETSITDPARYQQLEQVHQELQIETEQESENGNDNSGHGTEWERCFGTQDGALSDHEGQDQAAS